MNLPTPIFAGNWKLNHGVAETRDFFRRFLDRVAPSHPGTIAIFPPALALTTAAEVASGRDDILLGVQNIHWEPSGAFTGEISGVLAREAGASLVLVGHSERRHVFGETDEESGRKVRAALDAGLVPVLCVGETLEERESGQAFDRVARQIVVGTEAVRDDDLEQLVVAYEPVWAIGTGRTAAPSDASDMHQKIRETLGQRWGDAGSLRPVLYGGSVKPDNASQLLAAPGVDGLLVGGASLDPAGFAAIAAARG